MKYGLWVVLQLCVVLPVFGGIGIQNGLTHHFRVEHGKSYKGKIVVENFGTVPQSVKLYQQSYSYRSDGASFYTDTLTGRTCNAPWIKLNTNLLTLGAKQQTDVFFEITIPENLSEPGSYWSVIMVEPVDEIVPFDNKQPGINITSLVRYGIQIITDFETADLSPQLKFEHVKVVTDGTNRILKTGVANHGKVFCRPAAVVELIHAKTGKKMGPFLAAPMGLLPDNSKSFDINMGVIPAGLYSAVIMVTDENENTFAIEVDLDIKDD